MRRSKAAAILAIGLVTAALHAAPSHAQDPSEVGRWLAPFSEDGDGDGVGDFDARPPATREESARLPAAVNAAVLPDGRVLYWSQLDGTEDVDTSISFQLPGGGSRSRVLDLSSYVSTGLTPSPSAWSTPTPEGGGGGDMLGSDQRHLPDGRVLVVGGTEWANEDAGMGAPGGYGRTEIYGSASARVFDGAGSWTKAASMNRRRYYPTLITLPDGRLAAAGGLSRMIYNSSLSPGAHAAPGLLPQNVDEVEVFDPATGAWSVEPLGATVLPPFARLHLLPNGELFYPAVGMLFPPGGGDWRAAQWNDQRFYDPASGTWHGAGRAPFGVRSNAFEVLLPLEAPYDRARMLVGGGTFGPWPGSFLATQMTETITWRASDPAVVQREVGASLTTPRWHSTAVVLPTGEVVAVGGADKDEVVDPGSGVPVRHAEMLDPRTGEWTRLAAGARDRTLHHTAVLLRDGSILVGGHAPIPVHYGSHQQNAPGMSNNFKDPSFEIFQPPSLFRGPRPVIAGLSSPSVARGGTLDISTADAADPTLKVVFSRLPAGTHINDSDQRTVVVPHTVAGGAARAQIPSSSAVLPPGHYYVFLVKDNGQGPTPSVAEIVRVA